MREVDEALARAYAHREKGDPARGVPPAPHWPAHVGPRRGASASRQRRPRVPTARSAPARAFSVADAVPAGPLAELQWPAVVLGLERDWGDRFDRLAEVLIEGRRRQNRRAILFTSCHRAEGRTTLVLTLARAPGAAPLPHRAGRRRPHRSDAGAAAGTPARGGAGRRGRGRPCPGRCPDRRPRRSPGRLADPLRRHPAPRLPGRARLDLHPRPAPPRVRPDPAGRRPAVHRARAPRSSTARSTPPCSSTTAGSPANARSSAPARSSRPAASPCWGWRRRSSSRLRDSPDGPDLRTGEAGPRVAGRRCSVPRPWPRSIRCACPRVARPRTRPCASAGGPVYETHYGLSRRPFGETVDPSAYVALPSHEIVLRRLRYALEQSRGPAVLYGPPGSGKTLLARRLASQLDGPAVHVTFPALPAAELMGLLAEELGDLAAPPATLGDALRHVRGRLGAMAVQGRRPLLVVDEAQAIRDPATFEALRLLLNFATDGSPDLSLLLVGGHGGPLRPARRPGRSPGGPLPGRPAERGRVVGLRPRPARRRPGRTPAPTRSPPPPSTRSGTPPADFPAASIVSPTSPCSSPTPGTSRSSTSRRSPSPPASFITMGSPLEDPTADASRLIRRKTCTRPSWPRISRLWIDWLWNAAGRRPELSRRS